MQVHGCDYCGDLSMVRILFVGAVHGTGNG